MSKTIDYEKVIHYFIETAHGMGMSSELKHELDEKGLLTKEILMVDEILALKRTMLAGDRIDSFPREERALILKIITERAGKDESDDTKH